MRRFIPTPVGNIIDAVREYARFSVHPHACGEHQHDRHPISLQVGSSPRLWGTLYHTSVAMLHLRFIPTPVGNIAVVLNCESGKTVHPHACGEHDFFNQIGQRCHGSSPRLWGTWFFPSTAHSGERFIPTPVGNILPFSVKDSSSPVHPHACGEHPVISLNNRSSCGSSPRLWGTLRHPSVLGHRPRFIPTPVGNISPSARYFSVIAVHPHACGEHRGRCE